MAGKITSLGLGSSVLNSDVIDKLRKADEDNVIKPIERKMERNIEKQKQLAEVTASLGTIKAHAKTLSDFSSFIDRKVSVSGDSVTASASAGIPVQSITMEVKKLAHGDINELDKKFGSREDAFSNEDATLKFYSNGNTYKVDIKAGMTLGEVSQAITDATDGKVMGIVMKVGGEKPYQLMINSKNTGENNRIYFGSVLKSESMSSQDVESAGEQDFYVEIMGNDGSRHKIGINASVKSSDANRMQTLIDSIKEALGNDDSTKDLLDNGDINFGLADDGKSIVINDKRGYEINVGGEKSGAFGFTKKQSDTEDLVKGKSDVKEGLLAGKLSVNGTTIDLGTITKKENTAEQNTEAILQALNAIDGVKAKEVNGKITLNTDGKEINIAADGEDASGLNNLGLSAGKYKTQVELQKTLFKIKNVQSATDSEALYNGATIKRSTNTIDDVVSGLTINLQKVSDEGKSDTITITQDTENLIKEVQEFVKAYNEAVPKLDAVTKFDPETNRGGVFNTESLIRGIRPSINQALTQSITDGKEIRSLMDYGISINDKSVMSLDTSKLTSAISADPENAKKVFYGGETKDSSGKYNRYDGIFAKVNSVLADLLEGGNARLKTFEQTLDRELKNYNKEKEKTKKMLDARYDTMSQRFASFDEQIAKANNSFNAVQMMIDQAAGNDKKK